MNSEEQRIVILGGGIAGLIMGYTLSKRGIKDYVILEAAKNENNLIARSHIYYVHSPIEAIEHLVEKKRVQTWAYYQGKFWDKSTPLMANQYAQRITDKTLATAIHHLDGAEKFGYFPENGDLTEIIRFYIANQQGEIRYGQWVYGIDEKNKVVAIKEGIPSAAVAYIILINTLPMPTLLKMVGLKSEVEMKFRPIYAYKTKVSETQDVYQELYIPLREDSVFYRMLLYNNTAIAESTNDLSKSFNIEAAFKNEFKRILNVTPTGPLEIYSLPSGRFVPIDNIIRKKWIRKLTDECNIFSFGRYGTWSYKRTDHLSEDAEKLIEVIKQKQLINGII